MGVGSGALEQQLALAELSVEQQELGIERTQVDLQKHCVGPWECNGKRISVHCRDRGVCWGVMRTLDEKGFFR